MNSCVVFEESIQFRAFIIWVSSANRSVRCGEFAVIEGIFSSGLTTGNHLKVHVECDIDQLERTRKCQLDVGRLFGVSVNPDVLPLFRGG